MPIYSASTKAIKIVFIYSSSSRKDKNLQQDLETHLSGLKQLGVDMSWNKLIIATEQEYDNSQKLHKADIIVLLINPDFISSIQEKSLLSTQIFNVKQRHERDEIIMIPLLLRQVYGWQKIIGELTPLPKNGTPVDSWQNRDEGFVDVAQGIEEIVEELKQYQQNLQQYRQDFYNAIKQEYPLSNGILNRLSNIKADLALKQKDTELIEQEIAVPFEEEYQQKLEQYKKEYIKKIRKGQVISPENRQILKSIQHDLQLQDETIREIEQEANQILDQPIQQIIQYGYQNPKMVAIAIAGLIALTGSLTLCSPSAQKQFEPSSGRQVEELLVQAKEKFEDGDYKEASKFYNKAIETEPTNIEAFLKRGNNFYYLKNHKAAIEDFTKVINLTPDKDKVKPDAYMNRAVVFWELKDKQKAIQDYQKAANLYKKQGFTDDYNDAIDRLLKLQQI